MCNRHCVVRSRRLVFIRYHIKYVGSLSTVNSSLISNEQTKIAQQSGQKQRINKRMKIYVARCRYKVTLPL